jgi:DNA-binding GntR family transcriptional regulator
MSVATRERSEGGGGLAAVQPRSLAEQVADSIVDGIAAGALLPGQRILEVELAGQLRVSRVPVREALKSLAAQGIIEQAPHRGTRIVAFDEQRIGRICEVRAALEKIAARDAARAYGAEPARLAGLDAAIEGMRRCIGQRDWVGVNKADIAFHREICQASGNEIVAILWEAIARHVLIVFGREILSETGREEIVDHHRALRDLLAAGPSRRLAAAVEGHILRLRRDRVGAAAG